MRPGQDFAHFAFGVGERLSGDAACRSDERFRPVADGLALRAACHVRRLRDRFPDLEALSACSALQGTGRGWSWDTWNAGVATALAGDTSEARQRPTAILDEEPIAP
ncbi:hypothetical protein [Streptomyces sp. NPDC052225]|uniref:hypothetical protein n=1 Tax=Streptomyces sp. NPDC052225 TaxID=3154949 RepID=UPI00344A98DF